MQFNARIKLASAVALLAPMLNIAVFAQENCSAIPEREVKAQALDEGTYNQLTEVYEDIGEEKYATAMEDLLKLENRATEGSYAQAIILQALGHTAAAQDDFSQAVEFFQKAVELNALPNPQHYQMIYAVAQILIATERYTEGLDNLNLWLCVTPEENITSSAYQLQGSAYIELEDYRKALGSIDKAIVLEKEPKKNLYQIKLGIYFELEELSNAAETLVTIISFWPEDESSWKQLSSVYLNIKEENKALSVLELAYKNGFIDTQQEILQLSSLYQLQAIPYNAAQILEEGLNSGSVESGKKYWEQVANAWFQARELDKALAAYDKAGQFSDDGKIDLRRGFILIDREEWDLAKEALARAIEKGGLSESETGNAYLLIGMSELELDRYQAATDAFNTARRYDRARGAANQWLEQVDQKRATSAG